MPVDLIIQMDGLDEILLPPKLNSLLKQQADGRRVLIAWKILKKPTLLNKSDREICLSDQSIVDLFEYVQFHWENPQRQVLMRFSVELMLQLKWIEPSETKWQSWFNRCYTNPRIAEKAETVFAWLKKQVGNVNFFNQYLLQNQGIFERADFFNSPQFDPQELTLETSFTNHVFIKPCDDLKLFRAGKLNIGRTIADYIERNRITTFNPSNIEIELVDPKQVLISEWYKSTPLAEYRCLIGNGDFVDCVQYRRLNSTTNLAVSPSKKKAIQDYIQPKLDKINHRIQPFNGDYDFQPKMWMLDLIETREQGLKILELNAFSCSGLYGMDEKLIFRALNQ